MSVSGKGRLKPAIVLVLALAACGLALAAGPGNSVIYKSIGADGAVTYSQEPVPGARETTTIDIATLTPEQRHAAMRLREKAQVEDRELEQSIEKRNEAWRRADQEVREATVALEQAEAALEAGREPLEGDWIGNVGRGTRLREEYFTRLAGLERQVNQAQARLDHAFEQRRALE